MVHLLIAFVAGIDIRSRVVAAIIVQIPNGRSAVWSRTAEITTLFLLLPGMNRIYGRGVDRGIGEKLEDGRLN